MPNGLGRGTCRRRYPPWSARSRRSATAARQLAIHDFRKARKAAAPSTSTARGGRGGIADCGADLIERLAFLDERRDVFALLRRRRQPRVNVQLGLQLAVAGYEPVRVEADNAPHRGHPPRRRSV